MNDLAGIKFFNAIRKIQNKDYNDNMLYGKIKTLEPISVELQSGVIISEKNIFIGQACRPYKVKIPHTHEYNGKVETNTTGMVITTVGQATTTVVDNGHNHQISKQITEDVHKEGTDFEESVIIEIEPKLKEGDKVLLFAFNNFQMFYVAERLEQ